MKIRSLSFLTFCLTLLFAVVNAQAATITVTEKLDSFNMGNCSLRDAVESVNTGTAVPGCVFTGDLASDNIITLEAGTYNVSLSDTGGGSNNADGDIDFEASVVIQGQGMDVTFITGAYPDPLTADRILKTIGGGIEVSITGLTVSNGGSAMVFRDGGGIRINFDDQVRLQDVKVADNQGDDGGGIFNNSGAVLLQQSVISGNVADGAGGGILNFGEMAINESTIDDNEAADGGGIFNNFGDDIVIYNSTISNNRAVGGIPQGGGGDGGGVFIGTTCSIGLIVNSTISTNTAGQQGGGVFVGSNQCLASTDNIVGQGVLQGTFLLNDTIAFNEALESGGEGGGIWFVPETIPFSQPGAAGSFDEIILHNTILAQNQAESGPDCFDTVFSLGFNLFGVGCTINSLNGNPDQIGEDPLLDTLGDNGGPTFTHGLMEMSPAIDRGNNLPDEGCLAPDFNEILNSSDFTFVLLTRDQRNFPRPIAVRDPADPICDVGAFEFQVFDFTITKDDGLGGEAIPTGTTFDYTITVTNNGPGTATAVTLDDPLPSGMDFVSVTPSQGACAAIGQVIGCDLGDLAVGETATITVTVIATLDGSFTNIVTVTLNNPNQQQLTETAQVTTVVTGGLFVFGSGLHCGLQPGITQASPGFAWVVSLMGMAILGAALMLRRRANG